MLLPKSNTRLQFWRALCVAHISIVKGEPSAGITFAPRSIHDVPFDPPTHTIEFVAELKVGLVLPYNAAVRPPAVSRSEPLKLQRCRR